MSVENKTQIRHQLWFRVCDTWLKCLAHTHSFFAFKLLLFFGCFSSHCNIWTHIRARSVSRWSNEYRFSLSKAFCLWIMNVADLTKMDYFFFTVIYSHTRTHCIRMYSCTRRHTQLSRLLTNFDLNTALPEQQYTRSYQFSERNARRRRRKKQLWNMCIWRIETHLCLCWSFFCFTFSYDFLFSLWVGIRCVQWMYNWQPWPVFASNESN